MSDLGETFFTAIGCMDGRVQAPIARYGQNKFQVQYPDTITEAGLVGLLSNNPTLELLEGVKKKVLISVEKHHSKGIVVHGHQECAGNPVDDSVHKQNTLKACELIRSMVPTLKVKPVFVIRSGQDWVVEELE
jgi:carbonic anhydrase